MQSLPNEDLELKRKLTSLEQKLIKEDVRALLVASINSWTLETKYEDLCLDVYNFRRWLQYKFDIEALQIDKSKKIFTNFPSSTDNCAKPEVLAQMTIKDLAKWVIAKTPHTNQTMFQQQSARARTPWAGTFGNLMDHVPTDAARHSRDNVCYSGRA
jgi:hypothetical protein